MTSLRFAHISDTHLGYRALFKADPVSGRNQRAVDIERAYETAVSDILTRDVPLVIHGGDVFHHTRPAYSALRCFVRQTRRLTDAGIRVIVIGGNHDTPRLRTSGTAFSVLELALSEAVFVTGYEQEAIQLDEFDLTVTAIPHGKLVDPLGASAIPEPGRRNVLVTHGLVTGVQLKGRQREPGEEDVGDHLLSQEFDYIALGHYHCFEHVRHNAWYSGATERMGFGDEDVDPGYAVVQLGAPGEAPAVTHIPIETRAMKTIAPVEGEGRTPRDLADTVLDRLDKLNEPDAVARVEFRNTLRTVRRETDAILRREVGDRVWHLTAFTRGDILAQPGERRIDPASTDIRALFDEFVAERPYDPAFAVAFKSRGRRALDDAIRAAENATTEDSAA